MGQVELLIVSESNAQTYLTENFEMPIRFLSSNERGASYARNLGASCARGQFLAFLDDDVILHPKWCELALETFDDMSIGAISGNARASLANANLDWIPTQLMWVVGGSYWDYDEVTDVHGAAGMNFCIRREIFFDAGGYNDHLGPRNDRPEARDWDRLGAEESELAMRIMLRTGKRVVFNPHMIAIHRLRRNSLLPFALLKRAMHVGHNRAYIQTRFSNKISKLSDTFVIRNLPKQVISTDLFFRPAVFWKRNSFIAVVLLGTLLGYTLGILEFRNYRKVTSE